MRNLAIIMICIFSLLCLLRCQERVESTDPVKGETSTEEGETGMLKINDSKDGIVIDDLLESIKMLGITAEGIGIPRKVIDTESKVTIKTNIHGNIFGMEDYGILFFDETDDDQLVVERAWIHIKETSYDECKGLLSEKFGDPIEKGDIPYAEVNGGAVEWSFYQYEDVGIRLSSASERDYRELHLEKNKVSN